jgi:hypothetical protein
VIAIDFVNYIGEWWKADVEAVVNQATQTGLPPNISDAHIVNGQTGAVPGCPSQGNEPFKIATLEQKLRSYLRITS